MKQPVSFSIIGGGGFRAQSFLRIAQALPELFRVSGIVVRNKEKAKAMEEQWEVPAYPTLERLLAKEKPDFVVVSVSKGNNTNFLLYLAEKGIPVLTETPPAGTVQDLAFLHERLTLQKAKIQVAEQYIYQPMQAARLSVLGSGRLGRVSQATVSITQTYHAASLLRRMLGIGFEAADIRAMRFQSPMVAGPDRAGRPTEERMVTAQRDLAWLDFGDKLGIYDFTKDQHRSWIRSNHLSVRGDRGEMFDHRLNLLEDFQTPLHLEFKRINRGEEENLEGYFLEGIMAGEQWAYRNPFAPARLNDDEIAIATSLMKMAEYVQGGPEFYGLPDASQDVYLGMLIEQAISTGEKVTATRQPWAQLVQ